MRFRLAAFSILLIVIVISYFVTPPRVLVHLWEILNSADMDELAAVLRSYGPWAILISIVGNTIVNISGLPTVVFSGANGLIFGFWGGVAVSWVAEMLGAVVAFLLFRTFLYKKSKQYIQNHKNFQLLERMTDTESFRALLIARLIPLSPSGLLNIAGAISPMSFQNFFMATALGKLPSVIAEVYVGRDLLSFQDNKIRVIFWILLAVGVYLYTRIRQRRTKSEE